MGTAREQLELVPRVSEMLGAKRPPWGFPGGSDGRVCLQCRRPGFDPQVGKIPWRRAWQPIPVFLPGKIPWTEEPGGLQSMGLQRVGPN